MTDEEIAEIKLAETWVGENGFGSDCNNINSVDANREMVNAFLAGLKAGRPKWHKVADGDLPKEGTVCLTARTIISGNVAYDVCSYYEGLFGENWFAWKEIVLPKEMKENV